MTVFVRAQDGQRYSLDHVNSYWDRGGVVQIGLTGQDALVPVDSSEWYACLTEAEPVIPAQPGTFVLDLAKGNRTWCIDKFAVLFWRYGEGGPVPVTVEHEVNRGTTRGRRHPVLFADGHVEHRGQGSWETLDAYLAWRTEEAWPKGAESELEQY